MSTGWRRGTPLLLVGALAIAWCLVPAVQAQVIHPDQIIGAPSLQKESLPESGSASNEPVAGDLEKGFDRQMMAPESDSSGIMDMRLLKTPDATDAENARESDSRSAVSF